MTNDVWISNGSIVNHIRLLQFDPDISQHYYQLI